MASFYEGSVEEFLATDPQQILARLMVAYADRGYTSQYSDQTLTWQRDLGSLRASLLECVSDSSTAKSWGVLLEFSIPRKELRIDIVLLIRNTIVVLEAKTGRGTEGKRQIEEYAMLLHYFHKASSDRRILPVIVSADDVETGLNELNRRGSHPQLSSYWIAPVMRISWQRLAHLLIVIEEPATRQLHSREWNHSPYFPVPTIIEAALRLRSGLAIREIAHSEASEHEIENVRQTIQDYVDLARDQKHHVICFLTGVPGSGKTLVGLGLAHSEQNKNNPIHFMSGNGPLVKVLQHLFTQESMQAGLKSTQARAEARTLIENVHVFARYHTDDNQGPPSNHAIIFDEAQRAWNSAQNLKKFRRPYSEPEMLLGVMERHEDWAAVVALVGGGQEINDGEAGLEEWGLALAKSNRNWMIYASPEVQGGGPSTAGHRLFSGAQSPRKIQTNPTLHLRTSNRSLRAEHLATWVNHVIEGEAEKANSLGISSRFPIFLSRDLQQTRSVLHQQKIGRNRCGLVGSSGATRLRAEGLEPNSTFHADYPWEHWYLGDETDVRSSYRCEVFATEFEIQGLELDWIGICWGGDFVWNDSSGWQLRVLRHGSPSTWKMIKRHEKRVFRRNAYRVLLTRARQGMIIFVPKGDASDNTNTPEEFDTTARYLIGCGVVPFGA